MRCSRPVSSVAVALERHRDACPEASLSVDRIEPIRVERHQDRVVGRDRRTPTRVRLGADGSGDGERHGIRGDVDAAAEVDHQGGLAEGPDPGLAASGRTGRGRARRCRRRGAVRHSCRRAASGDIVPRSDEGGADRGCDGGRAGRVAVDADRLHAAGGGQRRRPDGPPLADRCARRRARPSIGATHRAHRLDRRTLRPSSAGRPPAPASSSREPGGPTTIMAPGSARSPARRSRPARHRSPLRCRGRRGP